MVKPILTAREVAQFLDVDEITVYRLARKGQLPAFKVGGQWRFDRQALEVWMNEQMQRSTDSPAALTEDESA